MKSGYFKKQRRLSGVNIRLVRITNKMFAVLFFSECGSSIAIPDNSGGIRVIILRVIALQAPRMKSVKDAVNGFSFRNVNIGRVFVIEVLSEVGLATSDACFDGKRSGLERKLGTEKFDRTSSLLEI